MEENEIEELWKLVEEVMGAYSKATAKLPLRQLEFMRSTLSSRIGGTATYKLSEVINSAKAASGQVRDKQHHISRVNMHWSTFKRLVSKPKQL